MSITCVMGRASSYITKTAIRRSHLSIRACGRDQTIKRKANEWMTGSHSCFSTLTQPNKRFLYPFITLGIGSLATIVALNRKNTAETTNVSPKENVEELERVAALIKQHDSAPVLVDGVSLLYTACENGRIDVARLLLEKGASLTQQNDLSFRATWDGLIDDPAVRDGAIPMTAAIRSGNIELVELLMEYGAPLNEPNVMGCSPVFLAVYLCKEELALFLLKKGADIKFTDADGTSLLNLAFRREQLRVVHELLIRGEKICEPDSNGWNAVYFAAGREDSALLNIALQNSAKEMVNFLYLDKWTPLSSAIRHGNLENVKILVAAGADLSIKYDGMNILEYAKSVLHEMEYSEKANKNIEEMQAVVDFLQSKK